MPLARLMRNTPLIVLAVLSCLAFAAPQALAAAPPNDDFANAQVITGSLPQTVAAQLTDATKQVGEPWAFSGTVWFKWTATADQTIQADTCTTALPPANPLAVDTVIGVFVANDPNTPAVDQLTWRASDDDGCPDQSYLSSLTFRATPGTTYWLRLSRNNLSDNGSSATLRLQSVTPPANDDFAGAQAIPSGTPRTVAAQTTHSTVEGGEPDAVGISGVWFKWTPATTERITIDTCSSELDPDDSWRMDSTLEVFTADDNNNPQVTALSSVGFGDDNCNIGGLDYLQFDATGGTTYWIRVGSYNRTPPHPYQLRIRTTASTLTNLVPPTTQEPERPNPATGSIVALKGVWESNASITFAYAWQRCDALGANCAAIPGETNAFLSTTDADAGHTFVVSVTADDGTTTQTLSSPPTQPVLLTPTNDSFAAAIDLGAALPTSADGHTWFAAGILEAGEPAAADPAASSTVWYRWSAPSAGTITIDTCGTPDTGVRPLGGSVAVYTGTELSALAPVTAANANCGSPARGSRVSFEAVAGTSYWIQVASGQLQDRQTGFRLSITRPVTPAPTIDPFPAKKLPKSLGTVKPSRRGVAKLKKLRLTCGASATGPCTGTLTIKTKKTKVKGKRIASVSQKFKLTIKPGKTLDAKFKLSKKLVNALKKAKKLKASVTIKAGAPGFPVKTLRTGVTFKR